MGEDIEEFFINTKPVKIVVKLDDQFTDNYASAISTEVDATYSHTVRIIQRLEEFEIVETERSGRKKELKLTEKGKELAEVFGELLSRF